MAHSRKPPSAALICFNDLLAAVAVLGHNRDRVSEMRIRVSKSRQTDKFPTPRRKRIMSFRDAERGAKVEEACDGRIRRNCPTADGSIAKTLVGRNQG